MREIPAISTQGSAALREKVLVVEKAQGSAIAIQLKGERNVPADSLPDICVSDVKQKAVPERVLRGAP